MIDEKPQLILQHARTLLATAPSWADFYSEILSLNGIARQTYLTGDGMAEFARTPEYAEIIGMLEKLRAEWPWVDYEKHPTHEITVRLPAAIHEALQVEAHEQRLSLNQLCISKCIPWLRRERVKSE